MEAILDKLDAVDDSRFRNRRAGGDRVRFRLLNLPVRVTHPGGSSSERVVASRNLSASGMGFLYDSFLYNGTRVVLRLPRRLGGEDALHGKVVYCAHVSGAFHQVGVRFDQKIFPQLYVNDAAALPAGPGAASPAAARTPKLSGRLLVIDPQEMDSALVEHHLRDSGMQVVCVTDELKAMATIASPGEPFSAVLCELDVQAPVSEVVIAQLREAGFTGPVIAAAAVKVDRTMQACANSVGAVKLISKPYDRAELLSALSTYGRRFVPPPLPDAAVRAVEQGTADVKSLVDVCNTVVPPK